MRTKGAGAGEGQGQSVFTWALDIANDTPRSIIHEFYTYLCDTSTRTYYRMARY